MEFGYDVLVALHLLGMAALVGGWLVTLAARDVGDRSVLVMQRGAEAQFLTGLVLTTPPRSHVTKRANGCAEGRPRR